jgi:hypothetical protein
MNRKGRSGNRDVQLALQELRSRTAASLRAYNDAVPYASWLRRSEIERFTTDLSKLTERASQWRRPAGFARIKRALCWIARGGKAA